MNNDFVKSQKIIKTPDQKIRVFVSSTIKDLSEERVAALNAIRKLHLAPIMFELNAKPQEAENVYRAYVEQSHIFIGIYGGRDTDGLRLIEVFRGLKMSIIAP
jgi:glycerol dehydrogenase-like iron-containing ADH family enzyme